MTTANYYQCPICMLHSPVKRFPERILIDPELLGHIHIRECRGKKGFVGIGRKDFIDCVEEYPEVYARIKDIILGLTHSLFKHELIKNEDLPNWKSLDIRDEGVINVKKDLNFKLQEIHNLKSDLDYKNQLCHNLRVELDFKEQQCCQLQNNLDLAISKIHLLTDQINEFTEINENLQHDDDLSIEENY